MGGCVHAVMLSVFLGLPFKESECWFVGDVEQKLAFFVRALCQHPSFRVTEAVPMTNIDQFPFVFTESPGADLDAHLSLYRVRCKGALYYITANVLNESLEVIVDPSKKNVVDANVM